MLSDNLKAVYDNVRVLHPYSYCPVTGVNSCNTNCGCCYFDPKEAKCAFKVYMVEENPDWMIEHLHIFPLVYMLERIQHIEGIPSFIIFSFVVNKIYKNTWGQR